MPTSPLAYSMPYLTNIVAGFLVTFAGAGLALIAGVWYMLTNDYRGAAARPMAFRALTGLAVLLFIVGIFWQLAGYLRLEYTNFFVS